MEKGDDIINPSFAAALMKLDPDDGAQIMDYIRTQALLSREKALLQSSVREQKKLLVENAKLKKDIEDLRGQLQDKQRRRLAKALFSPAPPPQQTSPASSSSDSPAASPVNQPAQDRRDGQRRKRGDRRVRSGTGSELLLGVEPRLDVSRLDLRVGRVLSARNHAHSLSIQEVDVGEAAPRAVVSKLGPNVQLDQLPGAMVVLICNVKARKLRGVVSKARLVCCSQSKDCIELLTPPPGSTPGDRITFLNFPGEPDKELPSKERVFERLQPDLCVDSKGVAQYKGCGFEVKGKGLCRAPTLINCSIR
ncbi:aminoacyl tRNA synthase complex-interacting multifunctional protein 1-like [Periophthalmus magnuspinnatus]|uniref:aminoacyl tRNA synthase complex-interacting multifunctional protein 1-like n=1 Tax=Periophthalmus magnuspinnatus TaxID=409849 RepID=UPI00145A096D|nr:aminoacyl tRNA synthase complex-interacting multifunctional protein 1-like [Periophthalmus magnuspinnatus]